MCIAGRGGRHYRTHLRKLGRRGGTLCGIRFQSVVVRRAQKSDPDFSKITEVLLALVDGIPKGNLGEHLDLTLQSPHFWTLFHVLKRLKIDEFLMIGPKTGISKQVSVKRSVS